MYLFLGSRKVALVYVQNRLQKGHPNFCPKKSNLSLLGGIWFKIENSKIFSSWVKIRERLNLNRGYDIVINYEETRENVDWRGSSVHRNSPRYSKVIYCAKSKIPMFSRRKKEQRFINKTVDKLICEIMNNASPEKCVLEILVKRNII